jgi:3-hydroxyacyl-[acyl-carrier-protein] dehydratase
MTQDYDIASIMQHLPHRYPFLLVDRVLDITMGTSIRALKNVTINEPFFQGHFPGLPVMPGVLIVEALAQAAGVLVMASLPPEVPKGNMFFMGIDKVKFRAPVVPGDQLILEVEILKQRRQVAKVAGVARVNDKIVAEGELLATLGA